MTDETPSEQEAAAAVVGKAGAGAGAGLVHAYAYASARRAVKQAAVPNPRGGKHRPTAVPEALSNSCGRPESC